jgi:hypothetical protein
MSWGRAQQCNFVYSRCGERRPFPPPLVGQDPNNVVVVTSSTQCAAPNSGMQLISQTGTETYRQLTQKCALPGCTMDGTAPGR